MINTNKFNRLKIRLKAVWSVLTTEFILISNINTFHNEQGQIGRSWATCYRTSLEDEIDFLVVKGEAMKKYDKLPDALKADNQI